MVYSKRLWASLRRFLVPTPILILCSPVHALPAVSVSVDIAAAHESGPSPGVYEFSRTGDNAAPLSVSFSLSGSATRDTDYLFWEPTAEFAAGSSKAWVSILPRNDSLSEGDEMVILTLQPGTAYAIDSPSQATITIGDAYAGGYPGVWDTMDRESGTGRYLTEADYAYLDASITDGALNVTLLYNYLGSFADFALYIDVDQNPATGDYRQGRVGGQEYRVSFNVELVGKWYLYKLRTFPPLDPVEDEQADELVGSGDIASDTGEGWASFSIPVSTLRNRQRVDVFAVTCPGLNVTSPGQGDRCPDYGALDSFSGQVVVRQPGITQRIGWSDPVGDAVAPGFDLTGVSWTSIADQFSLALTYSEGFDPSDNQFFSGPAGSAVVDGDRDLLTGCFGFGGPVPTFGGDNNIEYMVGSVMLPTTQFYIQTDTTRAKQYFGGDRNDAIWLCYAPMKTLFMNGSLTLMDAFRKTVTSDSVLSERLPTDGRVRISTGTSYGLTTTDMAPPGGAALDSPTGATLPAYQWDAARTITATDPLDANGVAGIDWTRVDAEVIDGNLVVKGTLVAWINTDYGNRLEVLLDSDMDASTGDPVNNPESGGPTIAVDNVFAVHSVRMAQDASVGYFGMLTPTGSTTTRHDAAIGVRVNFSFSDPGWFTATIPLRALQNLGPKVRFYVRSGYFMGIGGDTAPPQPMVISLVQGFIPADVITALRILGGLTSATDNRLNLDAVVGVTMSDAVHIARKVAGLEANP